MLALATPAFAQPSEAEHTRPTDELEPEAGGDELNPPVPAEPPSPEPPRTEYAGFPAIAANSQFGVLFGVSGSITHFEHGYAPFRWRMQLVAAASVRGSDTGITSPLQNVDFRIDFPGLLGGRLRVYSLFRYQRVLRAGYWGIGNGAPGTIPDDYTGPRDEYFTYQRQMLEGRAYARYHVARRVDVIGGVGFRGLDPGAYPDSQFARDSQAAASQSDPLLRGYARQALFDGLVGLLVDDRDDEFNPKRGGYHEVSLRGGGGPSEDRRTAYGSLYLNTRWFFPLVDEKLVLAMRAVADVGFGPMPLAEVQTMGGYATFAGTAGPEANRGLPLGRQLGRVKLLGSVELRSTFFRFHVKTQRFGLGAAAFVDASRVFASLGGGQGAVDGGPALRASYGGGIRFLWGQAFVLRFDLGASPRAGIDRRVSVQGTFTLGHAF